MSDAVTRDEFSEFVRVHWSALMAVGIAVSGSRADAEDLVQSALTSAYPRWHRIRPEQALAYLRRSILNAHVSGWRRHRGAELSLADLPDKAQTPTGTQAVEDRAMLVPLVRNLPPKQRAVVILRYLCDLPDTEIAETIEVSEATVRSQAFRALATLRAARSADELRTVVPSPQEATR